MPAWVARTILASTVALCAYAVGHATLAQPGAANIADPTPREVIAGVPRSWPPQYGVDENGDPIGFAIDIMEEIAARAGLRVGYRVMDSFAEVSEAMNAGQIDLIPNSGITPDRAAKYDFTAPVEAFVVSIFVRGDTPDIRGADHLRGHKVGVVEFNIGQRLMRDRDDLELVVYRDAETALFNLVAGHVDAVVFPQPVFWNLARQIGIEDHIEVVGAPLTEVKRGIRVQKGETELLAALNQAVNDFVGTPAYQAIYVKWYGRPEPFWTVWRVLAAASTAVLLVLIAMAWWRYHSIVKLNRELRASIAERGSTERALRKSEELFKAFIEHSPTKIHIKDADGRYILINKLSEELFGQTNEEARGKTSHDIFPKDVADAFAAHDRAVVESGQAITQEEEFRRGGKAHTFLTVKFPIKDSTAKVVTVGSVGTDITERKLAERCILEAKEEAELAKRAMSEFLANMSHELRTPLNAIIGFAEVIQNEILGPGGSSKYREYATDIGVSGQHLLELINDILDLSKIESGTVELREEHIDVLEVARSSILLLKARAQSGSVSLEQHLPKALPELWADRRRVKQILVNLLSNAVKFTPPGGRVSIKVWHNPDTGHVFQVADTGIGMAPQAIRKALAPFQQIDSQLNRKYEGSGLGLPLAKSLVELHRGTLELQSKVGTGTTVTVRFPAERMVSHSSAVA